jgi:hypothetical protein
MAARKSPARSDAVPRDDGYLSLRALAVYSDMSVRTLRNYLAHASNPIPHYKMDGKILVKRSEFDAWMRSFRVEKSDS